MEHLSDYMLSVIVYVALAAVVMYLSYCITRRFPSPWGVTLWLLVVSFVVAPTITPASIEGHQVALAPAIVGVLFAVLSKETTAILVACVPIFWTFGILLGLYYFARLFLSKSRA